MTARIDVLLIVFVALLSAGCASQGVTRTSAASDTSPTAADQTTGNHAGLRVFLNPKSGEFAAPPAGTSTTAPVDTSFNQLRERSYSRSHQGLLAVPNATPGGGVRLDLQGRFRSNYMATKDANGKLSVYCTPENDSHKH